MSRFPRLPPHEHIAVVERGAVAAVLVASVRHVLAHSVVAQAFLQLRYVAARFQYLVALRCVFHQLDPLLLCQLFLERGPGLHHPVLPRSVHLLVKQLVTVLFVVCCVHQLARLDFLGVVRVASPCTRLFAVVVQRLERA